MHRTSNKYSSWVDAFFKILALIIFVIGIGVRLAVFLQNRNLFIDEANIARNIYERNVLALATPLSYEQYAPPVFLWMLKLFTFLFGYGEMAFRIYPLLAGFGSLVLLYMILKELTSLRTLWYPLGLFVVGYMSIRYATELKQYISDVLVVLGLIWLALRTDIFTRSRGQFILIWLVAGSVGIWAAMPSVFVLSGVGFYYLGQVLAKKDFSKTGIIVAVGFLWLAQFAIYYFLILKPQIDSSYLQKFHQNYFLSATPNGREEWRHNWNVIKTLIQETSGFKAAAFRFNLVLLVIGGIAFFVRRRAKSLLVIVPLAAAILAAALNQYSLIPRVALFMTPLMLILIGYGLHSLVNIRPPIFSLLLLPVGLYFIYSFSSIKMAWERYETEEITDAMDFVISNNIQSGQQVYVHNGARPAFIYYTQIHPQQSKWKKISAAHLLLWDANYDELARNADTVSAYIFTSVEADERQVKKEMIERYNNLLASLDKLGCSAFVYRKMEAGN